MLICFNRISNGKVDDSEDDIICDSESDDIIAAVAVSMVDGFIA